MSRGGASSSGLHLHRPRAGVLGAGGLTVSLKCDLLLPAPHPLCMRVQCAWVVCMCVLCPGTSDPSWVPVLPPGEKVMADDEFTQDLFRFLQLLCEGHNNGEKEGGQGGEDTRRQLRGGPWEGGLA